VGGNTLKTVLDRGRLVCGVHGTFQGFGFLDPDGKWSGFDVDFCRAWAAALFDDPEAVDFRGLSAQERFTALQAGEVDVLSRNSTWSLARDTELGLDFGPTTFYDGQAMMVKKALIDDPAAGLATWRRKRLRPNWHHDGTQPGRSDARRWSRIYPGGV
jgi:general L-amino acid transport system substrate-binding protein